MLGSNLTVVRPQICARDPKPAGRPRRLGTRASAPRPLHALSSRMYLHAHGAHRSRTDANIRAKARLPRLLRNRAVPSKPFARMRCAVPCIRLRRGDARVSRRATGRMDGGSARRDTRSALSSVAGRTPSTFPRRPRLRRRTSGLVSVGPRTDGPVPHSGGACRNPNGTKAEPASRRKRRHARDRRSKAVHGYGTGVGKGR